MIKSIAWCTRETNPQQAEGYPVYHTDHLGTPQRLTHRNKQVYWKAHYHPFGETYDTAAVIGNNLRFPGQYHDEETGLNYNWHRYYDSEIGRYRSSDPLFQIDRINPYAYVHNNPLNWIDPWGLGRTRSFWQRWRSNFEVTNRVLPGWLAPPGVAILTAGKLSQTMESPTLIRWILSGLRGTTMGASTFTGLETGIVAGAASGMNYLLVGLAYELGVAIGSAINVGIDLYMENRQEKYPSRPPYCDGE